MHWYNIICLFTGIYTSTNTVSTRRSTHAYSDPDMSTGALSTYYTIHAYTSMYTLPSLSTSQLPTIYVITASISVGVTLLLLVTAGLVIFCYTVKRILTRRTLLTGATTTTTPMASPTCNGMLYEEISPIYETLSINKDFQGTAMMDQQELFTHADTDFTHLNSCFAKGIEMITNEAYSHSTSLLQDPASDSNSKTSGEHDYDVCSSTAGYEEGLFETFYDDTVIWNDKHDTGDSTD